MASKDMIKPSSKKLRVSKSTIVLTEDPNEKIMARARVYGDGGIPFLFELKYGSAVVTSATSNSKKHIQQMMKYMVKSHSGNIKRIGVYDKDNDKEILWLPEFPKY